MDTVKTETFIVRSKVERKPLTEKEKEFWRHVAEVSGWKELNELLGL